MSKPCALSFLLLASIAGTANAKIIHIPGDYTTIQYGINAATDGDTVLVDPGDYKEHIDFEGKAIRVASHAGPSSTIMDGDYDFFGIVVTFAHSEQSDSILEGFTIKRAIGEHATCICCTNASPTIIDNVITNNGGDYGSVYFYGGAPTLIRNVFALNTRLVLSAYGTSLTSIANVFRENRSDYFEVMSLYDSTATFHGDLFEGNVGGFHADESSVVFESCIIRTNGSEYRGGFYTCLSGDVEFDRCVVSGNRAEQGGGAIYCGGTGPRSALAIESSVFFNNSTPGNGGAVLMDADSTATINACTFHRNVAEVGGAIQCAGNMTIRNSISWADVAGQYPEISPGSGTVDISYSDIQGGGWPGAGTTDRDPQFRDGQHGDVSLRVTSPCIDAGDPSSQLLGKDSFDNPRLLDGHLTRHLLLDMGAVEFDHVHLTVTPLVSGQNATLTTSGTAGLTVLLMLGTRSGAELVPPFGSIFFDPGSPWFVKKLGTIPPSGSFDVLIPVPPWSFFPVDLVLQELAFDPASLAGNTSNAIEVVLP